MVESILRGWAEKSSASSRIQDLPPRSCSFSSLFQSSKISLYFTHSLLDFVFDGQCLLQTHGLSGEDS